MPALPPVPTTLKVTIPLTVPPSTTALNRIFIHYTGTPPTSTQLSTFCDAVSTAWNTRLASLHANSITQFPITAEDLNSAAGAVAAGTTSHVGTRGANSLPSGTCLMIQHLIARRYRGGKPKVFLPAGVNSDIAAAGNWGAGLVSAANTGWTNFIADIVAAGWAAAGTLTHVNVSYYSGFTVVTNPVTHRARNVPTLRGTPTVDTVTGYSVENGFASQRRRNQV